MVRSWLARWLGLDPLEGLLDDLGPGYRVARGIPSPAGTVDAVVMAERAGLFVLLANPQAGHLTRDTGRIVLNGVPLKEDWVERAAQQAAWLREQVIQWLGITVWVTPVVVFTRAAVEAGLPVGGVHLVEKAYLGPLLKMPRSANPAHSLIWQQRERLAQALKGIKNVG